MSEQIRQTARARALEAAARAARLGVEQSIAETRTAEQKRLDDGPVLAHELAVAADFERGARAALAMEQERERKAQLVVKSELTAEAAARRNLGAVSAEAEVIDTHRGQFRVAREQAEERAEEEAAEEQWTAKRYPPARA